MDRERFGAIIAASQGIQMNEEQPTPRERIYHLLCDLLTGRSREEDWATLSLPAWELLVQVADAEGVAPLTYWRLRQASAWQVLVPESARLGLSRAYYDTACRNVVFYRELDRILDALAGAQVPVIVLKSAALARTLYLDIALRPMGDIDLLVPSQQLERAARSLQPLGYHETIPGIAARGNWVLGHHVHLTGHPPQKVIVELHWNLIGSYAAYSPPLDLFWERTVPFDQNSSSVSDRAEGRADESRNNGRVLEPATHLLYLSAHMAFQHGLALSPLQWFYDIHLLISLAGGRLDWDDLLDSAHQLGWAAALLATLEGTRERFHTVLPDDFTLALGQIIDPRAARLVRRGAGPVRSETHRSWDRLASMTWPLRLRWTWALAFPRPAYMRWRYRPQPACLWPLCYPVRWMTIVRRAMGLLLRSGRFSGLDEK